MRLHFSIGGHDCRRTTRFRQSIHFSIIQVLSLIMCAPESTNKFSFRWWEKPFWFSKKVNITLSSTWSRPYQNGCSQCLIFSKILIRPSAVGNANSPCLGNITSFALSLFEQISDASIVSNSSRSAISTSPFQIPLRELNVSEEQSK